jgi:hypothetical protein
MEEEKASANCHISHEKGHLKFPWSLNFPFPTKKALIALLQDGQDRLCLFNPNKKV